MLSLRPNRTSLREKMCIVLYTAMPTTWLLALGGRKSGLRGAEKECELSFSRASGFSSSKTASSWGLPNWYLLQVGSHSLFEGVKGQSCAPRDGAERTHLGDRRFFSTLIVPLYTSISASAQASKLA